MVLLEPRPLSDRMTVLEVSRLLIAVDCRDDRDQAFKWLDRAYDDHSMRPYITGPEFDRLRRDPRYAALLRKLRLQ